MIIQEFGDNDLEQILNLCKKNNINLPTEGKIIVVKNNDEKIQAFATLRLIMYIEPFISESPIASKRLWDFVENKMKIAGIKIVRCFTDSKNEKLFSKVGFKRIFKDKISLEKIIKEV